MQLARELLVFLLVGVALLSLATNSQVEAQRRGSSQSRDYVRKLFKWHSPAGRSNSAGSGRGLMKWMMMQNMFQTPAPQSNIIIIQPSQTTTATTSPTSPPTTTTTSTASRAAAPDADDNSESDTADGNRVKALADDEEDVSSISVNDKVAIANEAALKEGGGVSAAPEHAVTAAVNELNQRNGNYRNPTTTRRHPSQKSRQKPQSKRRNANATKKKKKTTKNRKNNNKNKRKNKRKQAKKKPQQIQLNGNTSNNSNNNNNNNIAIGDTSSTEGAGSNRIVVPNSSFGAVINAFRQLQNYQHQQQQQPAQSSQPKPQSAAHASRPLFNVFNS